MAEKTKVKTKRSLRKKFSAVMILVVLLSIIPVTVLSIREVSSLSDLIDSENEAQADTIEKDIDVNGTIRNMNNKKSINTLATDAIENDISIAQDVSNTYAIDTGYTLLLDPSVNPTLAASLSFQEILTAIEVSDALGENYNLSFWYSIKAPGVKITKEKKASLTLLGDTLIELQKTMTTFPERYRAFVITFSDGVSVVIDDLFQTRTDGDKNTDYDPRQDLWYQEAIRTGNTVTVPMTESSLYDDLGAAIGVPITNPKTKEIIGVLGCMLRRDPFLRIMNHEVTEENEYSVILDSNRRILLSNKEDGQWSSEDIGKEILPPEGLDFISDTGVTTGTITLDNELYYTVSNPIPDMDSNILLLTSQETFKKTTNAVISDVEKLNEQTKEKYQSNFYRTLWIIGIIAVILIVIAFAAALITSGKISRPLALMTGHVEEITGNHIVFDMQPEYETNDEIEILATAFNRMSVHLRDQINETIELSKQNERMETELNVATRIQSQMLPTAFPLFPDRHEFSLFASMDPAREVGGDFYDAFLIDDDHLATVVADVSDKGVPAALFMVISKTLIKTRARLGGTPAEILMDVNRRLYEENGEKLFVTVWLAILTISTGEIIETNAGHECPAIRKKNGEYTLLKKKHGFVAGGLPTVKYEDDSFFLEPGDMLFVYTDGVPEATNAEYEQFGTERMLESLNRHKDLAPEELLPAVRADVDAFVGEAAQFDDLTMLALSYR